MANKQARIRKAYKFFCDMETAHKVFTMEQVANATGWSKGTVDGYQTKKWYSFLKSMEGGYICEGVCGISEDAFVRIHAQRTSLVDDILRPRYSSNVDTLIDKSREAMLLAIQIYNNPLVTFSAPGYIVQTVIAFTSLFHAIFERDGIDYWHKKPDGTPDLYDGDYRYWELSACINKYYKGVNFPETENLSLIVNLRNKIEHRFLPELDFHVSGYCQAALLNYEKVLIKEFGSYFSLRKNLMLALQLSEFSPELQNTLTNVQTTQFSHVRKYIDDFCEQLPKEIVQSPNFSFRAFLIPKVGNHATSSDVALEFVNYDPQNEADMKMYDRQIALIKEKKVQVADQGKYLPTAVINEVKRRTGIEFNHYNHGQAWQYYKIRSKDKSPASCITKYCQYSEPFKQIIYTDAWVDFLCEKIKDPNELKRIKTIRF